VHVLLLGSGNLVRHVAATMARQGHQVVVLDDHEGRPHQQNPSIPGYVLPGGDNLMENMRRAGVERADMVIALSWNDNLNAMAAQIASNIFNVPRTLCHVGEVSKAQVYRELGINVLSSTHTLTDAVLDGEEDAG
jgi:trk system potassium uptake protein TrkA